MWKANCIRISPCRPYPNTATSNSDVTIQYLDLLVSVLTDTQNYYLGRPIGSGKQKVYLS